MCALAHRMKRRAAALQPPRSEFVPRKSAMPDSKWLMASEQSGPLAGSLPGVGEPPRRLERGAGRFVVMGHQLGGTDHGRGGHGRAGRRRSSRAARGACGAGGRRRRHLESGRVGRCSSPRPGCSGGVTIPASTSSCSWAVEEVLLHLGRHGQEFDREFAPDDRGRLGHRPRLAQTIKSGGQETLQRVGQPGGDAPRAGPRTRPPPAPAPR